MSRATPGHIDGFGDTVGPRVGPKPLAYYLAVARQLGRSADRNEATVLPRFIDGVKAYWRHPYRRVATPARCLWCQGSARLMDYGGEGPPLLLIPSLINRAYILDLMPERSLISALVDAGHRVLLLDWERPSAAERDFTLDDYVEQLLVRAFDAARRCLDQALVVIGYCMGGLLALALAAHRAPHLAGLALLATPWDFTAAGVVRPLETTAIAAAMGTIVGSSGVVPLQWVELGFATLDPAQVVARFANFGDLPQDGERAAGFVALEDWLADGVPLAGQAARQCLEDWYGANLPAQGAWRVAGRAVRPETLCVPAFMAVPRGDRIVPEASALALARLLPDVYALRPDCGHVGMVAGARARHLLWEPLIAWLRRIAPSGD